MFLDGLTNLMNSAVFPLTVLNIAAVGAVAAMVSASRSSGYTTQVIDTSPEPSKEPITALPEPKKAAEPAKDKASPDASSGTDTKAAAPETSADAAGKEDEGSSVKSSKRSSNPTSNPTPSSSSDASSSGNVTNTAASEVKLSPSSEQAVSSSSTDVSSSGNMTNTAASEVNPEKPDKSSTGSSETDTNSSTDSGRTDGSASSGDAITTQQAQQIIKQLDDQQGAPPPDGATLLHGESEPAGESQTDSSNPPAAAPQSNASADGDTQSEANSEAKSDDSGSTIHIDLTQQARNARQAQGVSHDDKEQLQQTLNDFMKLFGPPTSRDGGQTPSGSPSSSTVPKKGGGKGNDEDGLQSLSDSLFQVLQLYCMYVSDLNHGQVNLDSARSESTNLSIPVGPLGDAFKISFAEIDRENGKNDKIEKFTGLKNIFEKKVMHGFSNIIQAKDIPPETVAQAIRHPRSHLQMAQPSLLAMADGGLLSFLRIRCNKDFRHPNFPALWVNQPRSDVTEVPQLIDVQHMYLGDEAGSKGHRTIFGPYHGIFSSSDFPQPAQIADSTDPYMTNLVEQMKAGTPVVLLAWGASGAGKTTFLTDDDEDKGGPSFLTGLFNRVIGEDSPKFTIELIECAERHCTNHQSCDPEKCRPTKNDPINEIKDAVGQIKNMLTAEEHRIVFPTINNPVSSRSHVSLDVNVTFSSDTKRDPVSILVCDLAGYESKFNCTDLSKLQFYADQEVKSKLHECQKVPAENDQLSSVITSPDEFDFVFLREKMAELISIDAAIPGKTTKDLRQIEHTGMSANVLKNIAINPSKLSQTLGIRLKQMINDNIRTGDSPIFADHTKLDALIKKENEYDALFVECVKRFKEARENILAKEDGEVRVSKLDKFVTSHQAYNLFNANDSRIRDCVDPNQFKAPREQCDYRSAEGQYIRDELERMRNWLISTVNTRQTEFTRPPVISQHIEKWLATRDRHTGRRKGRSDQTPFQRVSSPP